MMSFPGIDNACMEKSDNPYVTDQPSNMIHQVFLKDVIILVVLWGPVLLFSVLCTLFAYIHTYIQYFSLAFFPCLFCSPCSILPVCLPPLSLSGPFNVCAWKPAAALCDVREYFVFHKHPVFIWEMLPLETLTSMLALINETLDVF